MAGVVDGRLIAAQLDKQAEALRNHASADYRLARALQETAGAVRTGEVPNGFIGVTPERLRASVASFAGMIGRAV